MLRFLRPFAVALTASILVAACGSGNAASKLAQAPEFQPKDQTKCGVEKSQARPLIVEWPSADRQELEAKVREGIVVVRYQGCQMDVLERCTVPAQYGYRGTTLAQDKVVMKDDDDLYANLPVGAARLEGKLEKSGQLTVDMDLVGRYEAQKSTVRTDELQGECSGATHFVYGVAVGAFDFYAGADATVGGGVGVAGMGVGGHSQADRETLTKNGDPDACSKATLDDKAPPSQCGALIRIEVVPLGEAKALAPTCPNGTQWDGAHCVGAVAAAASPAPAAPPSPQPASSRVTCPQGMASLAAGSFTTMLGDNVSIQSFCLDTNLVTVDDYAACVKAGRCTADHIGELSTDGSSFVKEDDCNYGVRGRGKNPINCVNWGQAATYCHAQGKRLPTQEEWEWASRGGSEGRSFPWGNSPPDFQLCWQGVKKRYGIGLPMDARGTCPVGSFPAGDAPGGIHDLQGNVSEWTSSTHERKDGGVVRIMRGMSWFSSVIMNNSESSNGQSSEWRTNDVGFRCAQ